ncbi:hypothetical protein [Streptomyces sp. NPDC057616]|uniref:hypothetical protein n=1 Tax=Streptomyces sp. NPDC057616 TaxID=3346183 RepID=UPI0036C0A57D
MPASAFTTACRPATVGFGAPPARGFAVPPGDAEDGAGSGFRIGLGVAAAAQQHGTGHRRGHHDGRGRCDSNHPGTAAATRWPGRPSGLEVRVVLRRLLVPIALERLLMRIALCRSLLRFLAAPGCRCPGHMGRIDTAIVVRVWSAVATRG